MIPKLNKFLFANLFHVVSLSFLALGSSSSSASAASSQNDKNENIRTTTDDISIAFMIMLRNGQVPPNRAEGNGFERIIDYSLNAVCEEDAASENKRPCLSFPSSISAHKPIGGAEAMQVLNVNDYSMEIVNQEGVFLSVNTDDPSVQHTFSWQQFVSHSTGEVEQVVDGTKEDAEESRNLLGVAAPAEEGHCNALCQLTGQEYWCDCCYHCGTAMHPQRRTLLRGLTSDNKLEDIQAEELQDLADRIKGVALGGLEKWHHKMKSFQHQTDTGYILHAVLAKGDDVIVRSSGAFGHDGE